MYLSKPKNPVWMCSFNPNVFRTATVPDSFTPASPYLILILTPLICPTLNTSQPHGRGYERHSIFFSILSCRLLVISIFFSPVFFLSSIANAQSRISGHVRSQSEESIPGASLQIRNSNEGTSTDTAGNFVILTKLTGPQWLICSAVGYSTDSILVHLTSVDITKDFVLNDGKRVLSGVQISVRRNRIDQLKREYVYNDFDIVTTPGALADVVSALQTMPGAAPSGNETGLFVHGGAASETQVYFDGMLVKNAFGSRLPDIANRSRFSPFLFNETSFSTAAYPVQYGQALSSILSLETKGLAAKTSSEIALTTLGGGAAHTQRFKNSSLVIGGNYYNFSPYQKIVPQNTLWETEPKQYDGMVQFKSKVTESGTLKIFANYMRTDLSFDIRNPNTDNFDLLENTNKNLYLNVNYQGYVSNSWKIFGGIAHNHTSELGTLEYTGYYQKDNLWQEKIIVSRYFGSKSVFNIGVEQFQNSRGEGFSTMQRSYEDILSAGFLEAESPLLKDLVLKAGIRMEYSSYLKKNNLAPRATLAWYAGKNSQLTVSWGEVYQKPDDSFLSRTPAVDFEKATGYNIDYQLKLNQRYLRMQLYYKNYDQLVKISTPVFSGFQAYGPPLDITAFSNDGNGFAKGLDLYIRDFKTFRALELSLSYSYLNTKRNYLDYNMSARPAFAPAHTINLVSKKVVMKYRGQIAATYTLASGRSYFNPQNPVLMGNRTKLYQNVSLAFSYMPEWFKHFCVLQISANNILGFSQIYGYRFSYDGLHSQPVLPSSRRQFLISFLMNFGDNWFNH